VWHYITYAADKILLKKPRMNEQWMQRIKTLSTTDSSKQENEQTNWKSSCLPCGVTKLELTNESVQVAARWGMSLQVVNITWRNTMHVPTCLLRILQRISNKTHPHIFPAHTMYKHTYIIPTGAISLSNQL
jgi:hypothetical protein